MQDSIPRGVIEVRPIVLYGNKSCLMSVALLHAAPAQFSVAMMHSTVHSYKRLLPAARKFQCMLVIMCMVAAGQQMPVN